MSKTMENADDRATVSDWDPEGQRVPRVALVGAAILIAFSLTLAGFGRFAGIGTSSVETGKAETQRELVFLDSPDGSIVVRAAPDQALLARLPSGTNGFVRVVMRGMALNRKQIGVGADAPFRLTQWENGRLSIADTVTGKTVHLDGFGRPNRDAFARLLEERGTNKWN